MSAVQFAADGNNQVSDLAALFISVVERTEDKIINTATNINITNKWICEFGAWDGIHYSNTYII